MSVQQYIEDRVQQIDDASQKLGAETFAIVIVTMHAGAAGQWILHHPGKDKTAVAERLAICARLLRGEVRPDGSEVEATAEAKLAMLADECRKALKALDSINLERYFAEFEEPEPDEWATALLAMHDHLRPALNVLGLDYHKE